MTKQLSQHRYFPEARRTPPTASLPEEQHEKTNEDMGAISSEAGNKKDASDTLLFQLDAPRAVPQGLRRPSGLGVLQVLGE